MSNSRNRDGVARVTDDSMDAVEGDGVAARVEHPNAVPLLPDRELFRRVKAMLTPSRETVLASLYGSTATGVPPYVQQLESLTSALESCKTTLERVTDQTNKLRQTILDAFKAPPLENGQISRDQRPNQNGQITRAELVTLLDDCFRGIKSDIQTHIASLNRDHRVARSVQQQPTRQVHNQVVELRVGQDETTASVMYSYAGRFWDVPDGFSFPARIQRHVGWKLWLQGMPDYTQVGENGDRIPSPIKPFRDFLPRQLPKKLADTYKLHWRPIFRLMEEGFPCDDIPQHLPSMEVVDALYNTATEYLKTRVSYIFDANNKLRHNTWTLSTWSKHIGRSMITKMGSDNDKALLPEETRFNRSRAGRKRCAPDGQEEPNPTRRRRVSVVTEDLQPAVVTHV